jgi:hypothetical protein
MRVAAGAHDNDVVRELPTWTPFRAPAARSWWPRYAHPASRASSSSR